MNNIDDIIKRIQENKPKAQNFHSHVFVPIIQNLIGGFSIGLLLFFILSRGVFIYNPTILSICIIVSLSIASIVNIYRFFGDDLIKPILLVKLGMLLSGENKIKTELTKPLNNNLSVTQETMANALRLIKAHYHLNMEIKQKSANEILKMSRPDFESARRMLIDKNLLKNPQANTLLTTSYNEALERLK